jgi:hypothetical protein
MCMRKERASSATCFFKWKRERYPGSIVAEPPEGPPVGEDKQFVMVADDFLPYMRAKAFPFQAK